MKPCELDTTLEGCQNGKVWCKDPRCAPYCNGCSPPPYHSVIDSTFFVILIFIFACFVIVLFLWLYYENNLRFSSSEKTD